MARINKAELASDLSDLLVPGDPVALQPREVSDELIFVQPLLTGTHKFRTTLTGTLTGAVGATALDIYTVPANRYAYIVALDASHNDPVSRNGFLYVKEPVSGLVIALTDQNALATSIRQGLKRTMLIPTGYIVGFQLDAIAAGSAITGRVSRVEYLQVEPHPNL